MTSRIPQSLIEATRNLSEAMDRLTFSSPVAHVYNPLNYAWPVHELYLKRFAQGKKKALFLGMNPGPFGMVQTGIPFGEIAAVRDWMQLPDLVSPPVFQHPKRGIEGFSCSRSEVSGRRLWSLVEDCWGTPENFFKDHLVLNYCPLAFLSDSGANVTPDKLKKEERNQIESLCDAWLQQTITLLSPETVVGVGGFARKSLERILKGEKNPPTIGTILHPSPASPIANREWPEKPRTQLKELGLLP